MRKSAFAILICFTMWGASVVQSQDLVGAMGDIKPTEKDGAVSVTRQAGVMGTADSIAKKDSVRTLDILNIGENTLASVAFDNGGFVKMRNGTRMEILSMEEIFLMDGHLFVNSKWQAKKGRRFQIKTKKVVAGTMGTEFSIFHSEAADSTSLAVFKGAVKLESLDPTITVPGTPVVVNAGEAVSVVHNSVTKIPSTEFKTIKSNAKSWQRAMGPRTLPVWGIVVPAAVVTGVTTGAIISSGKNEKKVSTTSSGTVNINIPSGS